jgi:hypothetical protein
MKYFTNRLESANSNIQGSVSRFCCDVAIDRHGKRPWQINVVEKEKRESDIRREI